MEVAEALFNDADVNGDGALTFRELRDAMNKKGYRQAESKMKEWFKDIDYDGSGKITIDEFLVAMNAASPEMHKEALYRRTFRQFDKDDSGHITKDELHQVMIEVENEKTEDEIKRMIELADVNQDGQLDYKEFLAQTFGK